MLQYMLRSGDYIVLERAAEDWDAGGNCQGLSGHGGVGW